ncbi:MAG: MDR family MFS transporter/patatin-like phospholipase family protein [Solirubrobacteraceae bacterium]
MPPERAQLRHRRSVPPRTVLIIACLGVFMAFIDNTIVTIAFPNMLRSFHHATLGDLSWVFNIYNVALGALLVPAGRLADLLGRRRVFAAGVAIFTFASTLCAVCPSVELLVAARALQGVGAATLIPASLALILEAYPAQRRGQAIAMWSATGALAAGIGPSIGGLLVVVDNWRLVFLINLPVGVIVHRLAQRVLVESRAPGKRAVPDLQGALLLALSVGLLSIAIVEGRSWGWLGMRTVAAVVVSAILAAIFVRRCRTHPAPIIDLTLFRSRNFQVASVLTIIGSAGFFALGLANILYLMDVWRYSALTAGLAGTPAPFVAAAAAALAGKLAAKRDSRPLIILGAAAWTVGPLFLIDRFSLLPRYLTGYLPAAVILAIGIGVTFPLVGEIAVADAPGGRYAAATALNSAIRQVGAALGVAILVAVVGTPTGAQTQDAFRRAWMFSAICFGCVTLGALLLRRLVASGSESEQEAPSLSALRPVTPLRPPTRPELETLGQEPLSPTGEWTLAHLLSEVPLFADIEPDLRERVAAEAEIVNLEAGQWIFRQGDVAEDLYVVRSGRIEIVDETPERPPTVLRELARGSAVGELALITDSRRTASARVRRDAVLVRIGRTEFEQVLADSPAFARGLLSTLADWLSTGHTGGSSERTTPAAIVVVALDEEAAGARLDEALAGALAELAPTRIVTAADVADDGPPGVALAARLDRLEHSHDHVVLAGGVLAEGGPWLDACVRQADRVLLVVDGTAAAAVRGPLPSITDVVLLGGNSDAALQQLLATLHPRTTYRVRRGPQHSGDVAAIARRLAGRSVGLVLSGGGARGFCHIGVLETLAEAGIRIDRIAGTSIGAFIGALFCQGMDPAEIDACCYEEWVRRNPVSDYRVPRISLLRGERARAMLERTLPGRIEDLNLGFSCVSTDLISAAPVRHRLGPLAEAVSASMALPIFVPPVVIDQYLLVDGGLMDNLPTEALALDGEGPIIAVDVSEPSVRALPPGISPEIPTLPETLFKVMLLSESNDARRRSFADLLIQPDFESIGILEFHMLDRMRAAGRHAATAALADAPASIWG